ncbi:Fur family transcriptional regulator [Selenomonas sp.]|uniref:Fur family transcriptional regulator n=1 Tax=Selenomonas sp. TaxID=2053611 RepID=UPI0025EFFB04|nr:Fur family transcriptional regulator [Selenomonas sp.]MCI6085695.1 transcriptional repressor [Selenomonas sp.]MDY3297331.1 Fur family transcriptional regulator [Selenomonas sp.]MDY4415697.1 Fur family transcriptional regulator [Selenomonas sp.]
MSQTFTMDDLRARLSERQHKMTPQRQIVLQIFLDHPGEHLSAEDVHDILRTEKAEIGLATVYRTLELLSDLGILQKMEFGDGCSRYEVNDTDPTRHHHHHLICTKCGKVEEFDEDLLETLEADIERKTGFRTLDHQVKFFGICKECQEKGNQ